MHVITDDHGFAGEQTDSMTTWFRCRMQGDPHNCSGDTVDKLAVVVDNQSMFLSRLLEHLIEKGVLTGPEAVKLVVPYTYDKIEIKTES